MALSNFFSKSIRDQMWSRAHREPQRAEDSCILWVSTAVQVWNFLHSTGEEWRRSVSSSFRDLRLDPKPSQPFAIFVKFSPVLVTDLDKAWSAMRPTRKLAKDKSNLGLWTPSRLFTVEEIVEIVPTCSPKLCKLSTTLLGSQWAAAEIYLWFWMPS